jgi:hypothetical protein
MLWLGALAYVCAWLLPVHKYGTSLSSGGVPGWEALRVALSPIWPFGDFQAESAFGSAISTLSGLTNLLVPISIVAIARRSTGSLTLRLIGWLLLGAGAINSTWFALGADRAELRIGYYLWVASFLMLSVAALRRRTDTGV